MSDYYLDLLEKKNAELSIKSYIVLLEDIGVFEMKVGQAQIVIFITTNNDYVIMQIGGMGKRHTPTFENEAEFIEHKRNRIQIVKSSIYDGIYNAVRIGKTKEFSNKKQLINYLTGGK